MLVQKDDPLTVTAIKGSNGNGVPNLPYNNHKPGKGQTEDSLLADLYELKVGLSFHGRATDRNLLDHVISQLENPEPTYAPLVCIDAAELMQQSREIKWIMEDIAAAGTLGILAGESGVGKSWIRDHLAICHALGLLWLGKIKVKQGKTLIIDEENAPVLETNRLIMLCNGLGIDASAIAGKISFMIGVPLDFKPTANDVDGRPPRVHELSRIVKDGGYDLVIIDSLTRIHSANENSSNEMAGVGANLRWLATETGAAVVVTHHFNKGEGTNGNRIRGSSDIVANPDWTMLVSKEGDGLRITHSKARWAATTPAFDVAVNIDNEHDLARFAWTGTAVASKIKPWDWLRDQLATGEKSRPELVELLKDEGAFSVAELDKLFAWGMDKGLLQKWPKGKERVYALQDKKE